MRVASSNSSARAADQRTMRHVWICVLVIACSHDVRVRYPAAPGAPTGTLVLLLSQPAAAVAVAVNGLLVVKDRRTKQVTIEAVPVGTVELVVTASGGDKALRVWIDDTHPTTVPLGVPSEGIGFAKSLFATLLSIVAYSLLH
jgi:hypothetical protein